MPHESERLRGDAAIAKQEREYNRSRSQADRLGSQPGESGEPIMTLMGWADAETECEMIRERNLKALEEFKAQHPGEEVFIFATPESYCLPAITMEMPKVDSDAHLGAEEKPYVPLMDLRHHGSNVHCGGKGSK